MQSSTTCTHTYVSLGHLNKSIIFFFSNPPSHSDSIQTQVEPHKDPAPVQAGRPCRVSRPHTHHNAMHDLISCGTYAHAYSALHAEACTYVRAPTFLSPCIALHAYFAQPRPRNLLHYRRELACDVCQCQAQLRV